jgi:hypothetical protein
MDSLLRHNTKTCIDHRLCYNINIYMYYYYYYYYYYYCYYYYCYYCNEIIL